MIELRDQLGRAIQLEFPAKRIVSLVPSLTEYLADLGLENEVIGITKFCIKPKRWFQTKTRIGGTKQLNIQRISSLYPDLIIANKEENTKQDITDFKQIAPVYVSDIISFQDAYSAFYDIANLTGKQADQLINTCQDTVEQLPRLKKSKTCLYFIWQEPFMVVGSNNFINTYLERLGLINLASSFKSRYPEITAKRVLELDPDFIFLSSEPFPFHANHLSQFQTKFTRAKVVLVDGEAFSWYGSRMAKTSEYFNGFMKSLTKDCR